MISLPNENGVISLNLTSPGLSGKDWYARLEQRILRSTATPTLWLDSQRQYIRQILMSPQFVPTPEGHVHKVEILHGSALFSERNMPSARKVAAEARRRGLVAPPIEVACMLRCMMSDASVDLMGLQRIIVMHETAEINHGQVKVPLHWRLGIHLYNRKFDRSMQGKPDDGFYAEYVGPDDAGFTLGHGFAYLAR